MVSRLIQTISVLLIVFTASGSCWLDAADSLSNSLLPPSGWRLGNRELSARAPAPCSTTIDDPDTPDCGTLCGNNGPCTAGAKKKRDLLFAIQPENSTDLLPREVSKLSKRIFVDVLQNQLGPYLINQLHSDGVPDPAYGRPAALSNANDDNVVVQRQFGNVPFAIGTAGLCGCTVVTVVSPLGVYMGHFFEDPTWTNNANFQRSVLNFFGGATPPVGAGPQIDPALFPLATTRVYIMTARNGAGNPNSSRYRTKVPRLRTQIETALGGAVTFVTYNYVTIDCNDDDALFAGQGGCALFQFDPNSDGAGNPGWRLFYEQHLFRSTDPQPAANAAFGIPDV